MSAGVYKDWTFILSLFLICFCSEIRGNETDQQALLAFKAEVIHDPEGALSSWNMSLHFCSWAGITCSKQHKRVTSINLTSKGFAGSLSRDIGNMSFLSEIILYNNSLQGKIPQEVDRLFRLKVLSLGRNALEGNIPDTLGRLNRLVILELSSNKLSGMIPSSVFNLSSLNVFNLANNQLEGSIPSDFGLTHFNLQKVQLSDNKLSGTIPISLSNASTLQVIDLQFNSFSGPISVDFGRLLYLQKLGLAHNNLGFGEQGDLSFIDSLINCSSLKILELEAINLQGLLPRSIVNLSTELTMISLADNQISGCIPFEISKFINLIFLSLEGEIAKLRNLQRVVLSHNRLSGKIPASIGNLSMLDEIHLNNNELNGTIPPSFGNLPMLVLLDLSQNDLSGTITNELFNISPFSVKLNLSRNHLVGSLPAGIGTLKTLVNLDISENEFSGLIPTALGFCSTLDSLYLQGNFFQGYISQSMENLRGMQNVDLSRNKLSGKIPDFFQTISLQYLNLSWNNLEGEVPTKGVFANVVTFSIAGNNRLCGGIPGLQLPRCSSDGSNKHKVSSEQLFFLIGYVLGLLAIGSLFRLKRKRKKESRLVAKSIIRISYQKLHQATNGFSPTNLVSKDCFGSVYKGELGPQYKEKAVAIKVFNEGSDRSANAFITEWEVVQNIRQRNIVKIKGTCSCIVKEHEFKAIVYKFMEHGSLERWLHPTSMTFCDTLSMPKILNLETKMNIAIDVASALDYLHNQLNNPLAQCSLKPSNIWLDTDMSAHVSNFGLAKFSTGIGSTRQMSLTALAGTCGYMPPDFGLAISLPESPNLKQRSNLAGLRGTTGYIAPEYGLGCKMTTKGDTYSFGILLLEMLTGMRPTLRKFRGGLNLYNFVWMALPDNVMNITDPLMKVMTSVNQGDGKRVEECLTRLYNIGLACSNPSPKDRPDMHAILRELESIRNSFQLGNVNEECCISKHS